MSETKQPLTELLKKVMCPPGLGVHTIQTAKEKKEALWMQMYQTTEPALVHQKWINSLDSINNQSQLLLGIASDCGGGIHRGANWGPLAIREYFLKQSQASALLDIGDIRVVPHLLHDKYLNQETIENCREALYADRKIELPVSPLSITERALEAIYLKYPNINIIGLGGDHSVSYPLVKSWAKAKKSQNKKYALIHFDAHTDLLENRLGIDLCFGTWTYHCLNFFQSPSDIYQIGIRSSGQDRGHWESKYGVRQFWADEVNQDPTKVVQKILQDLTAKGIGEIYISFDIDALDEKFAAATGTPETGGLQLHDCIGMIKQMASKFKLTGADLTEVAPYISPTSFNKNHEPQTTLISAISILNTLADKLYVD